MNTENKEIILSDEDLVGRFVKVRVQRSVTVLSDDDAHVDMALDACVPVGVPLNAGASLLMTRDDVPTPISHSFWDHEEGVQVVTTNAVVFHEIGLDDAVAFYKERGWRVIERVERERQTRRDLFPLAHDRPQ